MPADGPNGSDERGVLLFYAYRDLSSTQQEVCQWYESLCSRQGLVGRVRVALDGLNATLGGSMAALRLHIDAVEARFGKGGAPIDFKLAPSDGGIQNAAATQQSGFDRLSVQACKEVVSMGLVDWQTPGSSSLPDAAGSGTGVVLPSGARHVEAAEFHSLLEQACQARSQGHDDERKETVLFDARNLYETQLGRFVAPGVEVLDPRARCFSDTPAWLEANQHRLAGRRILMACTGGVRCERSSAFLMSLGPSFQDVAQLKGGIQRYLEAFPDGGFFQGSNFVFDARGGVSSGNGTVVGRCVACSCAWGDYSHRQRCSMCRMLVLVCDACAVAQAAPHSQQQQDQPRVDNQQEQQQQLCSEQQQQQEHGERQQAQHLCELCLQRQQQQHLQQVGSACAGHRLRILCLHGFRQSGKNFEGRTHGLRRRLKDLADFVFVDAPHQLPLWIKRGTAAAANGSPPAVTDSTPAAEGPGAEGGVDQPPAAASAGVCWPAAAAELHAAAAEPAPCFSPQREKQEGAAQQHRRQRRQQGARQQQPGWRSEQQQWCQPRRAWLLTQEQYAQQQQQQQQQAMGGTEPGPCPAPAAAYADEWQFQAQTAGWQESDQELKRVLRDLGPFDGVLGLSQGAAVAGFLLARQWHEQQQQADLPSAQQQQQLQVQQQQQQGQPESLGGINSGRGCDRIGDSPPRLRFAIMCSGYRSAQQEHRRLLDAAAAAGGVALPTLHIYGSGAHDRQISDLDSAALADCFDPKQRFVIRHSSGHIIPSNKAVTGRVRNFLLHVQQAEAEAEQPQPQLQHAPREQGVCAVE
ncbi:hypothetical protein D9Q98_008663 [Chlorella vulgaris]|uniref:Rhodanese domain-containing protein n=1 Tax=Chlorella vulgaris TaxID=3077 RepID=A0A9D4TII5_CHLVU|nr:hypothetical protein D9Q98_008663 [Chlorella vulgaris]